MNSDWTLVKINTTVVVPETTALNLPIGGSSQTMRFRVLSTHSAGGKSGIYARYTGPGANNFPTWSVLAEMAIRVDGIFANTSVYEPQGFVISPSALSGVIADGTTFSGIIVGPAYNSDHYHYSMGYALIINGVNQNITYPSAYLPVVGVHDWTPSLTNSLWGGIQIMARTYPNVASTYTTLSDPGSAGWTPWFLVQKLDMSLGSQYTASVAAMLTSIATNGFYLYYGKYFDATAPYTDAIYFDRIKIQAGADSADAAPVVEDVVYTRDFASPITPDWLKATVVTDEILINGTATSTFGDVTIHIYEDDGVTEIYGSPWTNTFSFTQSPYQTPMYFKLLGPAGIYTFTFHTQV
jgi:hypothetical protein